RNSRTTARIPGAAVRRVGQIGDALVRAHFDDVVILDAGDRLPSMSKPLGIERGGNASKVNRVLLAAGSRLDGAPHSGAQAIVLHNIKSGAARGGRGNNRLCGLGVVADFAR